MNRTHKYNSRRTVVDGRSFASKAEAKRYSELKLLERAGQISHLQIQVPYQLRVQGEVVAKYVADFSYEESGKFVAEDTKGYRTDLYKLKRKLFELLYPEVEFREVQA